MIQILYGRYGWHIKAITILDDGSIAEATGLTKRHAARRLVRRLGAPSGHARPVTITRHPRAEHPR